MKSPKFPRTAEALTAYGSNLYAQAQKTGIPYTTLREWFFYGRTPSIEKLARFPDLLSALAEDVAAQATADVAA
jgi:uncharacterized protein YbjT (DUF2867 family)